MPGTKGALRVGDGVPAAAGGCGFDFADGAGVGPGCEAGAGGTELVSGGRPAQPAVASAAKNRAIGQPEICAVNCAALRSITSGTRFLPHLRSDPFFQRAPSRARTHFLGGPQVEPAPVP